MDNTKTRYRGRDFTAEEITDIQKLVKDSPTLNRAALSRKVCERLSWRKSNGGLKDMSARVAMLQMHEAGIIELPAPRNKPPAMVKRKIIHSARTDSQPVIQKPVHELGRIELIPVLNRQLASEWNEYVDRYHYLGHQTLPGGQMRYIAKADDIVVAMLGFAAGAWKTAPRDNYIGWDAKTRERNLPLVVNNARFLILPWVQSKNLASRLLSLSAKQLVIDWEARYNYRPVLLETFVEVPRFTGGCYKAANWIKVGQTTGRGKWSTGSTPVKPKKDVWLYSLDRRFKKILCS